MTTFDKVQFERDLKIMKKVYIILSIIAIAILLFRGCEIQRQGGISVALNQSLKDSLTTYKTKDGLNAAKISIFEADKEKDFISLATKDTTIQKLQKLVENNKSKIHKQGSISIINTETNVSATVATKVKDSILPLDSIKSPVYASNFNLKGWIKGNTVATKDSTAINLTYKEELNLIIGKEKTGFFGFDDNTGFFTFIPNATNSTEVISGTIGAMDAYLAGGSSNSIVYQSSANVTAFLTAGTGGNILQTNGSGSAPSWSNTLTLAGTANATSTTTGALQVVGGAGVGGNLYVGGLVRFINTTASTSTTTGALVVSGGVGIGKDLRVGGIVYATVDGSITTATNIAGGNRGQLLYQSSTGTTAFVGTGTAGQLLVSAGVSATGPVFTSTASIYVGYSLNAINAKNANTATNIAGGSSNSIVYQSSTGTTAFLSPATTSGWVLASTGVSSAPTWIKVATESATTATNIGGGTLGQIPFQTGTGLTSFFGPGTAGNVLVSAGTTSTGPVFQNTLTLASTTVATNTTTGALQVKGGVGIGGSVYVGNRVGFVNASNTSTVYQYYNVATNSLDTVFG